jgi:hypothetical protein
MNMDGCHLTQKQDELEAASRTLHVEVSFEGVSYKLKTK